MTTALVSWARRCFSSRYDVLWAVVVTGIAIAVRASPLRQPVSYDEAYTFLNFVNRGITDLFNYVVPNNHILHTLLARVSIVIFGKSAAAMRIPAFLAGVAAVPVTFALCRTMMPDGSGYVATAGVSVFTYLVSYATMARGYSLLVLLALTLALVGLHVVQKPSIAGYAILSVVGALGMLTIPTMLYVLGGVYLWLALVLMVEQRSLRGATRLIVACGIMTSFLTWLLYLPTIRQNGLRSLTQNTFVQPVAWDRFIHGIVPNLQSTLRQFSWNVPPWAPTLCAIAVLAGIVAAACDRNWRVLFFAPGIVAGSAVVLFLKQSIPFERTWMYLIPFALIAADAGVTAVVRHLPPIGRWLFAAVVLAVALSQAVTMIDDRTIASSADFPDGARIIQALRLVMNRDDVVHVQIPIDWQTYYYLWEYDVPDRTRTDSARNEFFVVHKRAYAITDLTTAPVVLIAAHGDGELYRLRRPDDR